MSIDVRWGNPAHKRQVTDEQIAGLQDERARLRIAEGKRLAEYADFLKGIPPAPAVPGGRQLVLMSAQHPHGWKLEDLLVQLRAEIEAKNLRLVLDDSEAAQQVKTNNQRVMACLFEAEGHQRRSLAALDGVGRDQGPNGRPRVGAGS